jgi:hypothetical protein
MPSAYSPDELNLKAAQPKTDVSTTFTIVGDGDAVWTPWSDAPRSPRGLDNPACDDNGVFSWTTGPDHNLTVHYSEPYSERCGEFVGGGDDIEVVLTGIIANFVRPNSGNINFNFTVCGYYEDEDGNWIQDCDAKAYVHYHHRFNETDGNGVVLGTDQDENDWLIFLGSVGHTGNAQLLAGELTGVTAKRLDGTIETTGAVLTWEIL